MKKEKGKIVDYFLGESLAEDLRRNYGAFDDPRSACAETMNLMDEGYKEYMNLFSQLSGKSKLCALNAHGSSCDGQWTFEDERGSENSVQDWVNYHSRNYNGIVLLVCNPGGHEIKSGKSILYYPGKIIEVSPLGEMVDEHNGLWGVNPMQFYSPVSEEGIIDSYTMEYETERLKKMISEKSLDSLVSS